MAQIIILAEHDNKSLHPHVAHCVSAAKQIDATAEITLIVLGHDCEAVALQAAARLPVQHICVVDDARLARPMAEPIAAVLQKQAAQADYVLAIADTFGKNVLPRIAAKLNTCQISDVIAVEASDTFKRPIYAGNAIATVQSNAKCKVMTIRPTAFSAIAAPDSPTADIQMQPLPDDVVFPTQFVDAEMNTTERPELGSARVVVSGGRGLQDGEKFKLLESLADKLGAAIGATRAAVDAGFVPNDYQVGQTGKVVAPELYIAIGISGAIQHLAGMKDSKVIVAINKDPDAPIFQVADYGLVGDLFEILPQLETALDNVMEKRKC